MIHSDLQRGFIRAEVIDWEELLEIGSWAKAKELSKLRLEGKDYEVATATSSRSASTSDGAMAWLVRGEEVLAAAEIAGDARQRRKGLVGRDDIEGALVLRPCRQMHTLRMRFPIDVAFCDRDGFVLHTATLAPWRLSRPVPRGLTSRSRREPGAFDRWKLAVGDIVEVAGDRRARVDGRRSSSSRLRSATSATSRPERSKRCATADVIAAEDTRRTRALLTHAGIPAAGRLRSVHAHNEHSEAPHGSSSSSRDGARVVYVSDAGMPGVSDPGERLVRACVDAGLAVEVVPGPSAVLAALVLSGLPDGAVRVRGLPAAEGRGRAERIAAMRDVAGDDGALRVAAADRRDPRRAARRARRRAPGGGRPGAHEAPRGGRAGHARRSSPTRSAAKPPRGECVIVIGSGGRARQWSSTTPRSVPRCSGRWPRARASGMRRPGWPPSSVSPSAAAYELAVAIPRRRRSEAVVRSSGSSTQRVADDLARGTDATTSVEPQKTHAFSTFASTTWSVFDADVEEITDVGCRERAAARLGRRSARARRCDVSYRWSSSATPHIAGDASIVAPNSVGSLASSSVAGP